MYTQTLVNQVLGYHDRHIDIIEKCLPVTAFLRGNNLVLKGSSQAVEKAQGVIEQLIERAKRREEISAADVRNLLGSPNIKGEIFFPETGKTIKPTSPKQKEYLDLMKRHDLVLSIGPAGTGKTFLAVAAALNALKEGKVSRIILTRPVVEAGEKLGFLPGDLYEKINPYLHPLYDAFYSMIGSHAFGRYRKDEIIEIIPLAYMRGRTLDNAFIVLDEAQNTTSDQMKMFLTRMGMDSQIVVTGDVTQVDLEDEKSSGLIQAASLLRRIKGIKFIYFSQRDVVRHPLVKDIILAYEKYNKERKE